MLPVCVCEGPVWWRQDVVWPLRSPSSTSASSDCTVSCRSKAKSALQSLESFSKLMCLMSCWSNVRFSVHQSLLFYASLQVISGLCEPGPCSVLIPTPPRRWCHHHQQNTPPPPSPPGPGSHPQRPSTRCPCRPSCPGIWTMKETEEEGRRTGWET